MKRGDNSFTDDKAKYTFCQGGNTGQSIYDMRKKIHHRATPLVNAGFEHWTGGVSVSGRNENNSCFVRLGGICKFDRHCFLCVAQNRFLCSNQF
jgi:hypothetical protein